MDHKTQYYDIKDKRDKEKINWDFWKNNKNIIKIRTSIIEKMKEIIEEWKPSILIIQEFEVNNSIEPMDFIEWMKKNGYEPKGNIPKYRASMTLFFVKGDGHSKVDIEHDKTKKTQGITLFVLMIT